MVYLFSKDTSKIYFYNFYKNDSIDLDKRIPNFGDQDVVVRWFKDFLKVKDCFYSDGQKLHESILRYKDNRKLIEKRIRYFENSMASKRDELIIYEYNQKGSEIETNSYNNGKLEYTKLEKYDGDRLIWSESIHPPDDLGNNSIALRYLGGVYKVNYEHFPSGKLNKRISKKNNRIDSRIVYNEDGTSEKVMNGAENDILMISSYEFDTTENWTKKVTEITNFGMSTGDYRDRITIHERRIEYY